MKLLLPPRHDRFVHYVISSIRDWNYQEIRGVCLRLPHLLPLLNVRRANGICSNHSLAASRPQSLPLNRVLEHLLPRALRTPHFMSAL